MKKSMVAVFAGLVSAAAFAGMDNVLVTFSTVGPDYYADGSQVEPGECYALVWTPSGSTFAGINADGTAAGDSKVVIAAPVATKDGNCPPVTFQVDENYARDNYPNGTWGVYLLDTRRYKTNDKDEIIKGEDGKPIVERVGDKTKVNGYGPVAVLDGTQMNATSASASVSVVSGSESPASAANLKITKIDFDGDNVVLHLTGSLSCLQYAVQSGDKPNELAAPADGKAQYGKDDGEMIMYTPKKPGAQFFKVNRK